MKTKKEETIKDNGLLVGVIIVVVVGIIGLYFLQRVSLNNRYICTYLGRLWMPDKEKNIPGLSRCYTYDEYYSQ